MGRTVEEMGLRARTAESGLVYAPAQDDSLLAGLPGYDRAVAEGQLHDYGAFFVGAFGDVLDDEHEVAEAAADWKGTRWSFDELGERQLLQLAQGYMSRLVDEGVYAEVMGVDRDEPSQGDLDDALRLVPHDVLEREYGDMDFDEGDFW